MSRRHIALGMKAEALGLLAEGVRSKTVAARLGIHRATLTRWTAKPGERRKPGPSPREPLLSTPCNHSHIITEGKSRHCADCGVTITPPAVAVREGVPAWLEGICEPLSVQSELPSPAGPTWRLSQWGGGA
jgi:hypothetical protein